MHNTIRSEIERVLRRWADIIQPRPPKARGSMCPGCAKARLYRIELDRRDVLEDC